MLARGGVALLGSLVLLLAGYLFPPGCRLGKVGDFKIIGTLGRCAALRCAQLTRMLDRDVLPLQSVRQAAS